MKAMHYSKIKPTRFDSEAVKGVTGRVAIGKADGAQNFCMRIFELSPNGFTPRHRHVWEHEIFIHNGKGELFFENKWNPLEPGYIVFIPGNKEHQIRNIGTEPLVFACLVPKSAPEL
jgi:quercetin dioxygenase-like cupin family protein